MKDVDLGEPTSLLDQVHLGCTQRESQTSKDIVDNYRNICIFEKLSKSQRHALMTTKRKKKKMGSVGDLSTVCSQIVLKCLYLARIGRPDI